MIKNKLYNDVAKNLGHFSLNVFKTWAFYNTLTIRELAARAYSRIPLPVLGGRDARRLLYLTALDKNGNY